MNFTLDKVINGYILRIDGAAARFPQDCWIFKTLKEATDFINKYAQEKLNK